MVDVLLTKGRLYEVAAQGYVLFSFSEEGLTKEHHDVASHLGIALDPLVEKMSFKGERDAVLEFLGSREGAPVFVALVGCGSKAGEVEERREAYRRALGRVIRWAEKFKITTLALDVPHPEVLGLVPFEMAKTTIAILMMASYQFNQFITDKKRHVAHDYVVHIKMPESLHEAFQAGIEAGDRIGHAVNQARHWCDLPADIITPKVLAERAVAIAEGHDNLSCTVFAKKELVEMGMGGILGVAQGSIQEPRFVVMEYKAPEENAPRIGLVGKGVTFDSGGISIKPAARMDEMKDDMAGAAAVIATMQAIAHMQPHVHVVACAPIVENMPSGSALKPGDILCHYNGKTSEVKNTDAEGRLILADALSYITTHYKLDVLIDIATLTGSCSAALGPFYAGLMTKHDILAERLTKAGRTSGERLWRLPFTDEYKVAVRSEVADVCNTGRDLYRAGAITAGFFLSHFIENGVMWAHLDIAGVSFEVPDCSYYRGGATGFGVRLFIEFIERWQ